MNNTTLIVIIVIINFISFIVSIFAGFVQAKRISYQSAMIEAYKKRLDDNYKYQQEMIKYCITDIYNRSVESEDYETAKKCQSILNDLKG